MNHDQRTARSRGASGLQRLLLGSLLLAGCTALEPFRLPPGSPSCRVRVHNTHDLTFSGELDGRYDLGLFPPGSERSLDLAPGRHALLFRAWIPWESEAASLIYRSAVEARAGDTVRIVLPSRDEEYATEPRGVEPSLDTPGLPLPSALPGSDFTW